MTRSHRAAACQTGELSGRAGVAIDGGRRRIVRIAIIGWGSLLWDPRPEFDAHHGPWSEGGPVLPLEFSRVSASRANGLTLVIDDAHGVACPTAFCLSTRSDPHQVIDDLARRENGTARIVGFHFRAGGFHGRPAVPATIRPWVEAAGIDMAVWTGHVSNFADVAGTPFSVEAALGHLDGLPPPGRAVALDYIARAPAFVRTPLREALAARALRNAG
jgi:hypothetical protein